MKNRIGRQTTIRVTSGTAGQALDDSRIWLVPRRRSEQRLASNGNEKMHSKVGGCPHVSNVIVSLLSLDRTVNVFAYVVHMRFVCVKGKKVFRTQIVEGFPQDFDWQRLKRRKWSVGIRLKRVSTRRRGGHEWTSIGIH